MATKEKPVKVTTFSYLTDKFAAGAARVNGGEYPDIDIAVVKATNHDVGPPKEKHVRTLRETVANAPSRRKIIYLIHDLYERMCDEGSDWLVVMKTLMVFHRLMKADNGGSFKLEMGKYKEKRKLTSLVRLDNFTDSSTQAAWDYSAFIRVYSIYLDERLAVYESIKFDIEKDIAGDTKLKTTPPTELLDQLPKVQKLLSRTLSCLPEGASVASPVIMESMKWILAECFRIYRAISEGVINLADKFFEMDRIDARKGLEIYKEAIDSTERLQTYFTAIQSLSVGRQMTFPQLQPPPADFLSQMEEYVKDAKGPDMPKQIPAASARPRSMHADNMSAVLGDGTKPHSTIPDLLDLSMSEESTQPAQATNGADFWNQLKEDDPFGDSMFQPAPSQSPSPAVPGPSPGQVPPALNTTSVGGKQPTPLPSILDEFLDLSINPAPQPSAQYNNVIGFDSQPPAATPFDAFGNGAVQGGPMSVNQNSGNPFGNNGFGGPAGGFSPNMMNPSMDAGFSNPRMHPTPLPNMGLQSGMGGKVQPNNSGFHGDPFLGLSADLGIKNENPGLAPNTPMRPGILPPPPQTGNPYAAGTQGSFF